MILRRINFIHILIGAAFLLGLILRFSSLGSTPLSDTEAQWALQALDLSRGPTLVIPVVNPQPAYVVLTSWLFDFFGASNVTARFWPALTGSLLILLPLLISGRISWTYRPAMVIMSFGIALAPGLVSASKQAGSSIMAVSFLLLALGLYFLIVSEKTLDSNQQALTTNPGLTVMVGIIGGLALLSGTAIVSGLLIVGLTWAFARLFMRNSVVRGSFNLVKMNNTWLVVSMVLTILLVGSSFFQAPQELAAWLETLPAYFQGWLTPSGIPILRMLAALLFYQAVAVIFGLAGAVRGNFYSGERSSAKELKYWVNLCLAWVVFSGLVVLTYPARQTIDMVWLIVPLWLLAGWEIQHYLPPGRIHFVSVAQAFLLVILMGLLWYSLASANLLQADDSGRLARYIVMIGILALGALITILIQLGWSWEVARLGLAWGLLGGLALFTISMLWGTAFVRSGQPQELWTPSPDTGQASLFLSTLRDLSNRNTGRADSVEIVSEVANPSMRWLLRDFSRVRFVDKYIASAEPSAIGGDVRGGLPAILITRASQEAPATSAAYRGQDFTWWLYPGWQGALPSDLAGWLTYRNAPVLSENIILWARSDQFPGGLLTTELSSPSEDSQTDADSEINGGLND